MRSMAADDRTADDNRDRINRALRVTEQMLNRALEQRGATSVTIRVPVNQGRLSKPRGSIEYEFA